jgi:hypothetical protein
MRGASFAQPGQGAGKDEAAIGLVSEKGPQVPQSYS